MKKFDHNAKKLSRVNLAYLARCANLVYENESVIKTALGALGLDVSQDKFFISSEGSQWDTQLFVAGDAHKIIISFRGTETNTKDWGTNLTAVKEQWSSDETFGEMHKGFYEAFKDIWEELLTEVTRLRTNNQTIWITGHSLGGALATVATATFESQNPRIPVSGVYTFGQPRVGDHIFANEYNRRLKSRSFRFVNNNDVVTRVPPQVLGYSHVGKLKYFDSNGRLRSDNNLSWWSRFWDRLAGRIKDVFDLDLDGIGDHSRAVYVALAERALEAKMTAKQKKANKPQKAVKRQIGSHRKGRR